MQFEVYFIGSDPETVVWYVIAEKIWLFLTNLEDSHTPKTFVEWIIIAQEEDFHVEFRVTWLECGLCGQALEVIFNFSRVLCCTFRKIAICKYNTAIFILFFFY